MEIIYINGPITDDNIIEKDFADAADLALFFEDNNIPYTVEYRAS